MRFLRFISVIVCLHCVNVFSADVALPVHVTDAREIPEMELLVKKARVTAGSSYSAGIFLHRVSANITWGKNSFLVEDKLIDAPNSHSNGILLSYSRGMTFDDDDGLTVGYFTIGLRYMYFKSGRDMNYILPKDDGWIMPALSAFKKFNSGLFGGGKFSVFALLGKRQQVVAFDFVIGKERFFWKWLSGYMKFGIYGASGNIMTDEDAKVYGYSGANMTQGRISVDRLLFPVTMGLGYLFKDSIRAGFQIGTSFSKKHIGKHDPLTDTVSYSGQWNFGREILVLGLAFSYTWE